MDFAVLNPSTSLNQAELCDNGGLSPMPLSKAHEGMIHAQEMSVFHGVSMPDRTLKITNLTALGLSPIVLSVGWVDCSEIHQDVGVDN